MRKTLTITLAALVLAMCPRRVASAATSAEGDAQEDHRREEDVHGRHRPGRPLGQRAGHDRRQEDDDDRGGKKTVKRHIDSIKVPVYPDHTGRSRVHQRKRASACSCQEALKAQSTHIYIISGATYTSDAFAAVAAGRDHEGEGW